jgi:NAD(P)-dependent dehydrogenase (short-subunit alcohol dehydrogenase family)
VAVITGTSRGIGRSIARAFAAEGAAVAGCARTAEAPNFFADRPPAERERCLQIACDVRESDQVIRFRNAVLAKLGRPDILVNNAGIVARADTLALREETWNDVLASNLTGTFLVTQAFLPAMKDRPGGRIIHVSSISGRQGTAMLSAYCAAKHGVVGLMRAQAEELRPFGISVNALCPGSVDTDMLQQGMPGARPRMTPDDIAAVALFLAGEAPSALTGGCIDVFG